MLIFKIFNIRKIFTYLIMFFVFIVLFSVSGFSLEISFLVGKVDLIRNGKKIGAGIGIQVVSGDMIITGKGGLVVLSYTDGSEIKVFETSKIRIGSKNIRYSDNPSVISGVVRGKFAKLLKGSERKVYSPTTVCSVRGTDFLVGVSDGIDSKVELSEGTLDLYNPYGNVNLKGKQNADIGVADVPRKKTGRGMPIKVWKNQRDEEFIRDPESKSNKLNSYIEFFNTRSADITDDIVFFDKNQTNAQTMEKKRLEETNIELEDLQISVTDDMILNEGTNSSLDNILNKFQKDKGEIYNTFLGIKEESNKVLEQQRRNYEAIKSVREAYQKAYNDIIGKHKDYMNKLKGGFNKSDYIPKKE
ncbi:MAG: FecR domain-containing protein [Spirochaetota bacterium]|nr:FecR domain-containing protein [Spirochaetota bacterium]